MSDVYEKIRKAPAWTSPPCQSHSTLYGRTCVARGQSKPIYFDAKHHNMTAIII